MNEGNDFLSKKRERDLEGDDLEKYTPSYFLSMDDQSTAYSPRLDIYKENDKHFYHKTHGENERKFCGPHSTSSDNIEEEAKGALIRLTKFEEITGLKIKEISSGKTLKEEHTKIESVSFQPFLKRENSPVLGKNLGKNKYDREYLKILESDEIFPDLFSSMFDNPVIDERPIKSDSYGKFDVQESEKLEKILARRKKLSENFTRKIEEEVTNPLNELNSSKITSTSITIPSQFKEEANVQALHPSIERYIRNKPINPFFKTLKKVYENCKSKGIELTPEEKEFIQTRKRMAKKPKLDLNDKNLFLDFLFLAKEKRPFNELIIIKKSEEKHKDCSVCLENFKENDEITLVRQCSHIFHTHCIEEWFKFSKKCPIDQQLV